MISKLPSYYKGNDWERAFNLTTDGCSTITFFQKCREYDTTILIIEDQFGYKFGGFCLEPWKCNFGFFGNGENLLFTFKDQDEPTVY